MESLSTVDQITHGLHYMVEALSYVHARVCFINIELEQFHVAETYIMQFENMSWWKKVMEQNKKFGGQGKFKITPKATFLFQEHNREPQKTRRHIIPYLL